MAKLLPIILLAACVSCDHKQPKPGPPPAPSPGPSSSGNAPPPQQHVRTHCIVISKSEAWSLKFGFEPEPVEILGLRFEVRGKCGLARVAVKGAASPVVASFPKLNGDGLLDNASKCVEVYWEKPVPDGTKIAGSVELAFLPPPAEAFPLCVTPLLSRPPSAILIAAPSAHHPYARLLQMSYTLIGVLTDPEDGLDTGAFSVDTTGAEVHSHQYIYHGWTLDPTPHTSVRIPVSVPSADRFCFTDILPIGVTAVHVEAIGFRINNVIVDACVPTKDASADVAIKNNPNGAYTFPSGLADLIVRFEKSVDDECTGLLTISVEPLDKHAPLSGSLHFTYNAGGNNR